MQFDAYNHSRPCGRSETMRGSCDDDDKQDRRTEVEARARRPLRGKRSRGRARRGQRAGEGRKWRAVCKECGRGRVAFERAEMAAEEEEDSAGAQRHLSATAAGHRRKRRFAPHWAGGGTRQRRYRERQRGARHRAQGRGQERAHGWRGGEQRGVGKPKGESARKSRAAGARVCVFKAEDGRGGRRTESGVHAGLRKSPTTPAIRRHTSRSCGMRAQRVCVRRYAKARLHPA